MKFVTEFTIDVESWLCGETSSLSYLVRASDSKQCCVGQWLVASGVPTHNMIGVRNIDELRRNGGGDWLALNQFRVPDSGIYELNDDKNVDETTRREELRDKFKSLGVTVHFSDEVKP